MKYLRKIIWLVIAVTLLAAVIIGVGVIFSVKNVNVTLKSYSYSAWDEMTEERESEARAEIDAIKNIVIKKYGGKLISYVDNDELAASLSDTLYILESCEKVYPCTLNITVKERREVFYISDGTETFSTYDSLGVLMRSGLKEEDAVNNIDKAPNIFITGVTSDAQIKSIANIASVFAEKFSSLRSIVKRIELQARQGNMIFRLRCGIVVHVTDYVVVTEAKIHAVYNKFMSLSGEEKLSGTIVVNVRASDGAVVAERFPDMQL